MEEKKRHRGNRRARRVSILPVFLIVLFSLFVLAYAATALYFTRHFMFNTYVNDVEAFNKTPGEIENEVTAGVKQYVLKINSRGGVTDTISANDISLSLRMDGQFEEALRTLSPFLWPKYLFEETHLTTDNIVVYSDTAIENLVEKLSLFSAENVVEPTDAHVSDEIGDDGFYVVPEDYGQSPIEDVVLREITAALDILEGEITLTDECYKTPAVFSDDATLNELCNNLNKYCRAVITYEFGSDVVTVDGAVIKDWCDINNTSVVLDEEKVRDFVNSMARKYDTFGKTRTIRSHTGETVEITGGDYGWWMDRATETAELLEQIKAGEKTTRTPVYFGTAAAYGENDWGDSYVEIDLTNQHLWVYSQGTVAVDSDFVSGCVNKGRTTPRGSYAITYKERDATLVGENYSSPVKYWMPFNGNVGMHDASWRSEFGGELYVTNGSHGCINLPTEKAAKIFETVEKGEAVFVYGGKDTPEPVAPPPEATPVNPEETPADPAVNPDGTPVEAAQPAEAQPAADPAQQTTEAPAEAQPAPAEQTAEQPAQEAVQAEPAPEG